MSVPLLALAAAKLKITLAVAGAATVGVVAGSPAVMSMTASSADGTEVVAVDPSASPEPTTGPEPSASPDGDESGNTPGVPAGTPPEGENETGDGSETPAPTPPATTTPSPTSTELPPCPADIRNHGAYVSSVPVELRAAAAKSDCGKKPKSKALSDEVKGPKAEKTKKPKAEKNRGPKVVTTGTPKPTKAKTTSKAGSKTSKPSKAGKHGTLADRGAGSGKKSGRSTR